MDEDANDHSTDEREFTVTERNQWNFHQLVASLLSAKPNDRSEIDRNYQVLITDLEKLAAYHDYWIRQRS